MKLCFTSFHLCYVMLNRLSHKDFSIQFAGNRIMARLCVPNGANHQVLVLLSPRSTHGRQRRLANCTEAHLRRRSVHILAPPKTSPVPSYGRTHSHKGNLKQSLNCFPPRPGTSCGRKGAHKSAIQMTRTSTTTTAPVNITTAAPLIIRVCRLDERSRHLPTDRHGEGARRRD